MNVHTFSEAVLSCVQIARGSPSTCCSLGLVEIIFHSPGDDVVDISFARWWGFSASYFKFIR